MPQFVILRHTMPAESERPSHFDLMLEYDGQLLTWALESINKREPQTAEQLPPHRLDYLTYEGPISNNRGDVTKVAEGEIQWLVCDRDRMELKVADGQCFGKLHLHRIAGSRWRVVWSVD